ncbi:MAG: hypothetical protein Q8N36_00065 [bacterium]|nr:hypothetical protein [bacterium]
MIANTNHINDYNLVHRYLCGDRETGAELYAAIFPMFKGFICSH